MKDFPLFIAGAKATNNFMEIISPFNGEVVGKVEKADAAAIEQALQNAQEKFENIMKKMPAHKRADILYAVSEKILTQVEELALLIAKEGGKPFTDAKIEVVRAANTIKTCGDEALQLNGEQITMDRSAAGENHTAFTIRQGLGPVLAVSAFNHPLNLICHQVGTAIAAGCTVIVKPASATPLSCLTLIKFFQDVGLEDGIINVVTAGGRDMDQLVSDGRIRFLSFIGGADVGWELRKKIAPGVGIALEHGGTGTAIVDDTADLDNAVASIVKGAFYHAGQVCVSTQRVIAHENIYDELLQRLKEAIQKLQVGDPTDPKTEIGPLINPKEIDRIENIINKAVKQGAEVVLGAKKLDNNCLEATLITNVNTEMDIVNTEVFGPVLTLSSYSCLKQTVRELNNSNFSFQSAIYSKNIDRAMYVAKELESKAVIINNTTAFRTDWMPFAASKHSGMGTGGVKYSIEDLTEEKLIVIKSNL